MDDMTQTTENRHDRPAPDMNPPAAPSEPFTPVSGGQMPPPLPPAGGLQPPASFASDRSGPAGSGRPSWRGVIAVGAGAAMLSSLLTAGVVTALQPESTGTVATAAAGTATQNTAPLVTATAGQPDWVTVASAVEPSVVSVQISSSRGLLGEGSGVVMDAEGRILTNNHVVSEVSGAQIAVVLSDGRSYPASIVGTDPATDLAVIKIDSPPSDLTPATFGDSSAVQVGDPVMALGNPLGLSDTVTTGIVSALDRPVTTSASAQQNPFGGSGGGTSEPVVTNAIQTDAAVNPGNSGGALVDGQGRVIGITSSIASLGSSAGGSSGSIGLGFAIPSNEAKSVADQLVSTGTVQHAYLGVGLSDGTVSLNDAKRQAAMIASVSSGTPAADAGLKNGDAVIAMNGEPLNGAESLIGRVRAASPGTEITLTVVRDGKSIEVPVTLAARPNG